MKELICKHCGKGCINPNSHRNHERCCPSNPNRNYKNGMTGKTGWAKGLTANTDDRLKRRVEKIKEGFKSGRITPSFKGHTHSQTTREKWEKNPNMGGKRKGSGRGKKGKYLGYYCDSTWELAWLIQVLDEGKTPVRNTKGFEYEWAGKIRRYFPDFLLEGEYIEIKGQKGPQWEAKLQSWKEGTPLKVIDGNEIRPYIQYAESKFGKEFWIRAYGDSFTQTIFKPGQ